ncbi:MAG: thiamine pyrophosphate-binding protein [Fimbriiglobus sp.]
MSATKVSDVIAAFLAERGVTHAFGISGAGNLHVFDSIARAGATELVCTHHEQAAVMAADGYFFARGTPAVAVLTTGGGAANGFTGVLGAMMQSVPLLVVSGNENSKYTRPDNPLRIYGVQGFDVIAAVRGITKHAVRVMDPARIRYELEKAWHFATTGRFGPVWLDIPLDIQAAKVDTAALAAFDPVNDPDTVRISAGIPGNSAPPPDVVAAVARDLRAARRPVIWLGQGVRLAGGHGLVPPFLDAVPAPVIVSWSGIDVVASDHPRVFGRAGVFGNRCANFVLQNCDYLLAIGTRLAVPQVGYDITEFARAAKIAVVDIDPDELAKYSQRYDRPIHADAGRFVAALTADLASDPVTVPAEWLGQCETWRTEYPTVGPEHPDADGFLNAYRMTRRLERFFRPDEVIVTDAGTAAMATHAVLQIRPPQRLGYSFGLGEMGWGLPAAVGASFARGRGDVLCLTCDGSMMLNLQELQTIAHHRLPVKILVISNDGYLSIKLSQRNLFGGRLTGSDPTSGVSCPRFGPVAAAFGIPAREARTWDEFDANIEWLLTHDGPALCEVFVHPDQPFLPKLGAALRPDGTLVSPPLEDLTPVLPRDELRRNMIVGMHPKSEQIG